MYIFDGNPNGRIMCELSNWNGRIYKVSRNELSVFSQRADAENTGVYFLLGKDENNTDTVYIGEAEKVCTRLKQHLHDADYWSDAIVVISKDDLLNKAHVKYLENRFYCLAQDSGRAVIICIGFRIIQIIGVTKIFVKMCVILFHFKFLRFSL